MTEYLSKLPFYGIKDKELTSFEDYLFGRRQCVIYDDTCSESQPVVCGVPQGFILGPMLFILLINGLDHQLNSCKILLYADDKWFSQPVKIKKQLKKT